jgi:N-acetylmuramoyl-L-alanine amidase
MNLRQLFLTKNDCYKAGKKIKPQGIMVHSTGANNPYLNRYLAPDDGLLGPNKYNNHWNMSNEEAKKRFGKPLSVCVHAFIGKLKDDSIATYQTLPWDHRGWHCGGSGNDTHISFEICEDNLQDAKYFTEVYQMAVQLTTMLCKQYKLDPMKKGVVVDHGEGHKLGIASNHADIGHWFKRHSKSMDTFRADVKKLLEEEMKVAENKNTPSSWAKEAWEWAIKEGITDGTNPKGAVTREQVVTMLYRYHKQVAKK